MPWNNQTGGKGPWGSSGNSNGGDNGRDGGRDGGRDNGGRSGGPWGSGPSGSGPGGPNFEDIIRRGQRNVKNVLPGGFGSPRGIGLIVVIAAVLWLATGFYRVQPSEVGAELIFGKLTNISDPGLHWNWPAPIGDVEKPNITAERRTDVGFRSGAGDLSKTGVSQESLMLTGDENIIDIQVSVFWRVDNRPRTVKVDGKDTQVTTTGVRNFLFNIRSPTKTVKDVTESALREIVGKNDFESMRTKGRVAIQNEGRTLIQKILDEYGAGIVIVRVELQKVDPPQRVLDAFRDVQAAKADKERAVNDANAALNRLVQSAEGEAERILRAAEAYREEKIAEARGETARFLSVYGEYAKAKDITRTRIWVETLRDVLKDMDKVIVDKTGQSGVVPYLPLRELNRNPGQTAQPSTTPSRPSGDQPGNSGTTSNRTVREVQ